MRHVVLMLVLFSVFVACDRGPRPSMEAPTGDAQQVGMNRGLDQDPANVLRSSRPWLDSLERNPQRFTQIDYRTAHKQRIGDLVNGMNAELNRRGVGITPEWHALSDSVLRDIGGGSGRADGPKAEDAPAHVARVRRLVARYEQLAAQGAPPGTTAAGSGTAPAGELMAPAGAMDSGASGAAGETTHPGARPRR